MGDVYPRFGPTCSDVPDIARFSSVDIDQARAVLNRFYYPVAVSTPGSADGFGLGAEVIQLGPLTVGRISFSGPVSLVVAELDAYHVSMPTIGRMQARHAGHEV